MEDVVLVRSAFDGNEFPRAFRVCVTLRSESDISSGSRGESGQVVVRVVVLQQECTVGFLFDGPALGVDIRLGPEHSVGVLVERRVLHENGLSAVDQTDCLARLEGLGETECSY